MKLTFLRMYSVVREERSKAILVHLTTFSQLNFQTAFIKDTC